ncbi:hypothetical protein AWRI3579_g918 [Hanseniaspora osmophila]|uniref:Uncharacterized protein n=1 Tax=Hanseniaspora osmophila TaxID=56408 RepID=A0A1E5RP19_9ASCO|nr:hypothetical protein AWRI3579_g918 [Hanseniaspora osmophila]
MPPKGVPLSKTQPKDHQGQAPAPFDSHLSQPPHMHSFSRPFVPYQTEAVFNDPNSAVSTPGVSNRLSNDPQLLEQYQQHPLGQNQFFQSNSESSTPYTAGFPGHSQRQNLTQQNAIPGHQMVYGTGGSANGANIPSQIKVTQPSQFTKDFSAHGSQNGESPSMFSQVMVENNGNSAPGAYNSPSAPHSQQVVYQRKQPASNGAIRPTSTLSAKQRQSLLTQIVKQRQPVHQSSLSNLNSPGNQASGFLEYIPEEPHGNAKEIAYEKNSKNNSYAGSPSFTQGKKQNNVSSGTTYNIYSGTTPSAIEGSHSEMLQTATGGNPVVVGSPTVSVKSSTGKSKKKTERALNANSGAKSRAKEDNVAQQQHYQQRQKALKAQQHYQQLIMQQQAQKQGISSTPGPSDTDGSIVSAITPKATGEARANTDSKTPNVDISRISKQDTAKHTSTPGTLGSTKKSNGNGASKKVVKKQQRSGPTLSKGNAKTKSSIQKSNTASKNIDTSSAENVAGATFSQSSESNHKDVAIGNDENTNGDTGSLKPGSVGFGRHTPGLMEDGHMAAPFLLEDLNFDDLAGTLDKDHGLDQNQQLDQFSKDAADLFHLENFGADFMEK